MVSPLAVEDAIEMETPAETLHRFIANRHRRLSEGVDAERARVMLLEIEQARVSLEKLEKPELGSAR
jgi:hypothetical protein